MRTRERTSGRPAALAVATAVSALVIVGVVAGPAEAKSDISASAVAVAKGGSGVPDRIEVTASGADDAGGYQRLCVYWQIGRADWHKLACAPVTFATGGTVTTYLPLGGTEAERFRARLFRVDSATGGHPVLDRESAVAEVSEPGHMRNAGKTGTPPLNTRYFWSGALTVSTVL